MIDVLALHGVVDRPRSDVFCDRNMVEAERLRAFLQSAPKFVPLQVALKGEGQALTIDDATEAAARTALLARSFGHAVTLFVNPWQVEDGRAYGFSWLNAIMDQANGKTLEWHGRVFELIDGRAKQTFREAVKSAMRAHVRPEQNYALLERIRMSLAIERVDIPAHLRCLPLERLQELKDAGVYIENHYWSHLDPAVHTHAHFVADWRRAQEWLRDRLGISSRFFACPFGEFFPPRDFLLANGIVCLLLHNGYPQGAIDRVTVNRANLM